MDTPGVEIKRNKKKYDKEEQEEDGRLQGECQQCGGMNSCGRVEKGITATTQRQVFAPVHDKGVTWKKRTAI